jgi:hypothetical protein
VLALCGVLDAIQAGMHLLMLNRHGSLTLRSLALPDVVWEMGVLAMAAGVCAIAAGLWSSGSANTWLLALHGAALSAFGLIGVSPLVKGPLSFRPVSLLFVVMAASIGVFALGTVRTLRTGGPERWQLLLAGAISVGFAFSFFAVGFNLVRLGSPHFYWMWMSSYFGFCAMFMLWLAFHVHSHALPPSRQGAPSPPLPRPRHAHW